MREPGVGHPDPAQADHPHGRASDLDAPVGRRVPAAPAPGAQIALGVAHPAGRGEGESHRQLRGRLGEDVRRVGDRDTPLPAGLAVDVVVTDREVCNHLEALSGGVQDLGIDRDARVGDQGGGSGDHREQPLARRVQSTLPDLEPLGQPVQARGKQDSGNYHQLTLIVHSYLKLTVTVM
jgi:hypothetical protein